MIIIIIIIIMKEDVQTLKMKKSASTKFILDALQKKHEQRLEYMYSL